LAGTFALSRSDGALRPWEMDRSDVDALRAVGLSDRDVVDANKVVAY
jgi:uncharacterized protein YciW